MQQSQDFKHCRVGDAVVDVLALAARGYHAFIAQDTELLGQRWLVNAKLLLKLADAMLTLRQLAQQQHTVFVGQNLENANGLRSRAAQQFRVYDGRGSFQSSCTANKFDLYYTF